ncbi:hypothetical protein KBA27_03830 [bacterium]|nr:hypothetical protein [bacterium]
MTKKFLILIILLLISSAKVFSAHLNPEKFYQARWCNAHNGIMEYKLFDATRVDCLTDTEAVEFDFAKKWAEAIGQSLYYGKITGKTPTIGLILETPADKRYYERILPLCYQYGINLYKIEP